MNFTTIGVVRIVGRRSVPASRCARIAGAATRRERVFRRQGVGWRRRRRFADNFSETGESVGFQLRHNFGRGAVLLEERFHSAHRGPTWEKNFLYAAQK